MLVAGKRLAVQKLPIPGVIVPDVPVYASIDNTVVPAAHLRYGILNLA